MIDHYLLLAPVLMLGVVALLGFVGCQYVYGVTSVPYPPDAPQNLVAVAGNAQVTLTWDPSSGATSYIVKRGDTSGGPYLDNSDPQPGTTYVDSALTNGMTYFYVVTAQNDSPATSDNSNEASATPFDPNGFAFVTSETLGMLRNNFTGWVGMAILVGASPVNVRALGRMFAPGNTLTHAMKIVNAATGADLPGGSVSVDMSTGTLNNFVYAALAAPVTLTANAAYYIVSQETNAADQFYHDDTLVQTTAVATVTSAAFGDGVAPFTLDGSIRQCYGPVDFRYI